MDAQVSLPKESRVGAAAPGPSNTATTSETTIRKPPSSTSDSLDKVLGMWSTSSLSRSRGCANPSRLSMDSVPYLLPSPIATPLYHVAWYRKDCYENHRKNEEWSGMCHTLSSSKSSSPSSLRTSSPSPPRTSSSSSSRTSSSSRRRRPSPHSSSTSDESGGRSNDNAREGVPPIAPSPLRKGASRARRKADPQPSEPSLLGSEGKTDHSSQPTDKRGPTTFLSSFSSSSHWGLSYSQHFVPVGNTNASKIVEQKRKKGGESHFHQARPPHKEEVEREQEQEKNIGEHRRRIHTPQSSHGLRMDTVETPYTTTAAHSTRSNLSTAKAAFIDKIPQLLLSNEKDPYQGSSRLRLEKHQTVENKEESRMENRRREEEGSREKKVERGAGSSRVPSLSSSYGGKDGNSPHTGEDDFQQVSVLEKGTMVDASIKEKEDKKAIPIRSTLKHLRPSPSSATGSRKRRTSSTHGTASSTHRVHHRGRHQLPRASSSSFSNTSQEKGTTSLHWNLVVLLLLSSLCTSFSFATLAILMNKEMTYDAVHVTKFWLVVSFACWSEPVMGLIADHVVLFGERRRPLFVLSCIGNAVIYFLFCAVRPITREFHTFLMVSFISQLLLVSKYVSLSGILVNVGYTEGESTKESSARISFIQSKARTWRCIGMFGGAILQTLLFACFSVQTMLGLTAVLFGILVLPILSAPHQHFAPPVSPLLACHTSGLVNTSKPSSLSVEYFTKRKRRMREGLQGFWRVIWPMRDATDAPHKHDTRCRFSVICVFVFFYTMMPNSSVVYQNYLFSFEYSTWYYAVLNCVGYLGNTIGSVLLSLWIDHSMGKELKGRGERSSTGFIFFLGTLSWAAGYMTNIMVCTGFVENTLHFPLQGFLLFDIFMSSIFEVWADAPVALSSTEHAPQGMELLCTQFFSVASMAGRSLSSALTLGLLRVQILHDSLWKLTLCSIVCRLLIVPFVFFLPNREHAAVEEKILLLASTEDHYDAVDNP